ncbi:C3 and PZP-like alpha-2-macroglobulin domain-containing protein 8 [Saguinus oedipus]|uniref:C3 and PZP-like alpha-2-macroglobulin domain-containing protein 8 n=1 Tax=Saguinus oedipus TaxID=9490 RepID=A0ABQ9TSL1_SAGOE|nr:C3 and PZP-like alpha-2-macroglobulin domain-containing protein 8 [Saguinus oedipus]
MGVCTGSSLYSSPIGACFRPGFQDRGQGTTGQLSLRADGHLLLHPQDTCVALQALAEYAILSYAGSINLTVSLASTNLDYQETFELHGTNQKLLQMAAVCVPGTRAWGLLEEGSAGPHGDFSLQIPSLPTGLFVSAKGDGCCLMQIAVTYNVPDPVAKPAFQLLISLQEPEAQERPPPMPASSAEGPRDRPPADDDDPAAEQHHQEYKVMLEVCTSPNVSKYPSQKVLETTVLLGALPAAASSILNVSFLILVPSALWEAPGIWLQREPRYLPPCPAMLQKEELRLELGD